MDLVNVEKNKLEGIKPLVKTKKAKKLYIETYGCQMNVNDSEVVAAMMIDKGFAVTEKAEEASVVLLNTCAIRENAEQRVRGRLGYFKRLKEDNPGIIVGVIGCMAERLKEQLLEEEKMVDLIAGPDAYRNLPSLVEEAGTGQKAVNVLLSMEETYADVSPVRLDKNKVSAFVSISRGCDNMCSFCVVPFTRGRERSRDAHTILREIDELAKNGYKEVTLLGQNVDKYRWRDPETKERVKFANLLEKVAVSQPGMRVRFSTSYPQDMTDAVLENMAKYPNICNYIHLPVQSGSSDVLKRMKRGYTREWYLERIAAIRRIIPGCAISTDIISGFCGETEEEHQETLSLMKEVGFDYAYMFKYSERPGTFAEKRLTDDVPEEVKSRRLQEIIDLQASLSYESNKKDVGKEFEVLIEGTSKKSDQKVFGRNSQNKVIVFDKKNHHKGELAKVKVNGFTQATLMGESVG